MKFIATIAALVLSTAAFAQGTFPDKPIRYIVPFAPGGESDVGARLQGVVFKKKYGQDFIVESKPGGGGAHRQAPGRGYFLRLSRISRSSSTSSGVAAGASAAGLRMRL